MQASSQVILFFKLIFLEHSHFTMLALVSPVLQSESAPHISTHPLFLGLSSLLGHRRALRGQRRLQGRSHGVAGSWTRLSD